MATRSSKRQRRSSVVQPSSTLVIVPAPISLASCVPVEVPITAGILQERHSMRQSILTIRPSSLFSPATSNEPDSGGVVDLDSLIRSTLE